MTCGLTRQESGFTLRDQGSSTYSSRWTPIITTPSPMFQWELEQAAPVCFCRKAAPRKAPCICPGLTCFRRAVQKCCYSTSATDGLESGGSTEIHTGRRLNEKAHGNANFLERSLCERRGVGAAVPGVVRQEPYPFNEGRRAYGSSRNRCEGTATLRDGL